MRQCIGDSPILLRMSYDMHQEIHRISLVSRSRKTILYAQDVLKGKRPSRHSHCRAHAPKHPLIKYIWISKNFQCYRTIDTSSLSCSLTILHRTVGSPCSGRNPKQTQQSDSSSLWLRRNSLLPYASS